jgi:hypothetical protein
MTFNEEITHRVTKHLNDGGITQKHLIGILGISRFSFGLKMKNERRWQESDIETLRENNIIKITVR